MPNLRAAKRIVVIGEKSGFRAAVAQARATGRTVGLVPTMGALHEGHVTLVRLAAAECDMVAVTIFVNPLQFDRADDLVAYPRTVGDDLAVAAEAGADVVFAPSASEMFGPDGPDGPDGPSARVHVAGLADRLEGESRPGHFDGVATVCAKLFSLAGPCRAYFGEKDFQQVAVVRRLVHDLDLPVEIVACPTVRAIDGLALSSRNARLTDDERVAAPALYRALCRGARAVGQGERRPERIAAAVADDLCRTPRVRLDRIDVVDADTLDAPGPDTTVLRILVAAFLGQVRLIDNIGVPV